MSDQLREAFRDLADDAPSVDTSAAASRLTWVRARRARRRAVASVAVGFVVLLVASVLAGVGLTSNQSTAPADTPPDATTLAIPTQVWLPSPWTPGTADAGPPGPLALMATAPRSTSWFHTDGSALFGVSAATGNYRFLDLPGINPDSGVDPVLSPNGLHIAYYVRGQPGSTRAQSSTAGYAVYDTVTGLVHVRQVATQYGLRADSLTWAGDNNRLLACYGQYRIDAGSGSFSVGGISTASLSATQKASDDVCGGSGFVPVPKFLGGTIGSIGPNGRHLRVLDANTGIVRASWLDRVRTPDADMVGPPQVSPGGERVAVQADPTTGTGPRLYIALLGDGPRLAEPVPSRWVFDAYGWTDQGHLLTRSWTAGVVCQDGDVTGLSGPQSLEDVPQIFRVDVSTGDRCAAIELHGNSGQWLNPTFATDLLQRPFTASVSAPRSYRDPRVLPAVGLALVVSVAVVLLLWRIRVRARGKRFAAELASDD